MFHLDSWPKFKTLSLSLSLAKLEKTKLESLGGENCKSLLGGNLGIAFNCTSALDCPDHDKTQGLAPEMVLLSTIGKHPESQC